MTRLSIFFLAAVLLAVVATIAPPAVAQTPSEPAAGAPSRPRVGLVLSGGGARGFAHVGVLQVLQELNVPIDAIAATSMGAIIGGSYAAGRTPAALERLVRETAWNDVFAARPPRAELPHRRKEDDFDNLFSFEFGVSRDGPTLPRGVVSTQNLNVMLRGLGAHVDNVSDLGRLPIPFAAMATDLATGQLAVLQKDVTLSTALRASMSVPGAFAPVEVHGQPLVDGGLVRNLPVDVVRRMGVDVVIAVNVGTPLLPRDKLDTVLAVGEQMINILTEQNVQRSLGELQPQDILIAPDLTKFTAADFTRGDAIIAAGAAAAREVAAQLRRLGVDHAAYARFEQRRIAPVAGDGPVTIAEVQVEGLRRVSPAAVRAELDVPTDRPVERSELAAATQRVFATGDFETVDYALVDGPAASAERRRLLIRPIEKSWGYNTLRLGGSIQTDFDSINTFDILAAHTWRWLNPAGAEWRNELQFGDTQRVLTEWYQPLAPGSRWFVMPQLAFERSIVDVFVGDTRLARLRNSTRTAAVYAGYALPRLGSVRVGTGRYRFRAATLVGEPLFDDQSTDANGVGFSINLDTLDTVNYPRRGFLARFEAVALDAVSGDEVRDRISDFELQLPVTFGRYTINASARGGTSTQFGTFQLGGLFNLSGTPVGRIAGSRYALLRLLAYRNISDAFGDLPTPVYVGVSLEAGDAVERDVSLSWGRAQRAGSIYVGTDSILGPLYFALGRTAGGSSAAYLFWGRPR